MTRSISVLQNTPYHEWDTHLKKLQNNAPTNFPILLFSPPEPVQAFLEGPGGSLTRFEWRRRSHHITHIDGPERISPEWWSTDKRKHQTRDYYRIEDESGRRFWLYREISYAQTSSAPHWFIHGVFA